MDYKYCVFIGRFQPFHKAHLQVVELALKQAEKVIIVVGSCNAARNIKNPWTFEERVEMISANFVAAELERIHFVPIRDYYYSDNIWVTQIQQAVNTITRGEQSIALTGSYKDASSYYIKYFPQWDFLQANTDRSMSSTDVRKGLFEELDYNPDPTNWQELVPAGTLKHLNKLVDHDFFGILKNMKDEYAFIENYKNKWAKVPFPVTFNTVDAVVVQSGHVLLVKRKFNPGKGLYALPGGFIKQTETLKAAAIRELKEETGIKLPAQLLESKIVESKVFDHPGRSLRGRTITHAFCFNLPEGDLPEVRGSDDADQAFWLPLMDVAKHENQFYEDHSSIINHFVSRF